MPIRAKFDSEQITPLHGRGSAALECFTADQRLLDVARCMPRSSCPRRWAQGKVAIVTGDDGDTEGGALRLSGRGNIGITVFYPYGKVSDIQRLQMVCQQGENVRVCAIRGNFDDAQSGVKRLFHSAQAKAALDEDHIVLSSANSINIGRLVPQIVYYFAAYRQLLEAGAIQMGEEVNFCVPTGNFGNVLAGYYAKLMGLPVHRLIVAANENNVLEDFLNTGVYDRNRPFHQTISPSMDILISSNLERMLYYLSGKDSVRVAGWMKDLAEQGRYEVDAQTKEKIASLFLSASCDNAQTSAQIRSVYARCGYVMDPHTAVGAHVLEQLKERLDGKVTVLLSTASPYKFTRD
ncbi:MAG: threonine synthase, partial [Merdibacter sp.]